MESKTKNSKDSKNKKLDSKNVIESKKDSKVTESKSEKKDSKLSKKEKNIRVDMLYAKLHRVSVTESNLNYIGSISIDSKLMDAAGMLNGMKVDVVNVNNGERFSTYAIPAKAGSGTICINGAAARKAQRGDIVIIIAYANMKLKVAKDFKAKIVFVDSKNRIVKEK